MVRPSGGPLPNHVFETLLSAAIESAGVSFFYADSSVGAAFDGELLHAAATTIAKQTSTAET
jgi:hypothetical protein